MEIEIGPPSLQKLDQDPSLCRNSMVASITIYTLRLGECDHTFL